ncbi:hypothetical protein C8R42DRAFT_725964 [Lentinula raphanica]|nr:hypothetical protein C8R42DRAFT_725964 [Lentinula raphanica]
MNPHEPFCQTATAKISTLWVLSNLGTQNFTFEQNNSLVELISFSLPTPSDPYVLAYLTCSRFSLTTTTHNPHLLSCQFFEQPPVMITFNSIILILLSTASVMLAAPTPTTPATAIFAFRNSLSTMTKELRPLTWNYQFRSSHHVVTITPKRVVETRGGVEFKTDDWIFDQSENLPWHKDNIELGTLEYPSTIWLNAFLLRGAEFSCFQVTCKSQSEVLKEMIERLSGEESHVKFIPVETKVTEEAQRASYPNEPSLPFKYLYQELIFAESFPEKYDDAKWNGKAFDCHSLLTGQYLG